MACRPFGISGHSKRGIEVNIKMMWTLLTAVAIVVDVATALTTVQRESDRTDAVDAGLCSSLISLAPFHTRTLSGFF